MVKKALEEGRPYAMAFVDIRMPPGWDGVETTLKIWEIDSEIQIVICTAYSDYSWEEMFAAIGNDDRGHAGRAGVIAIKGARSRPFRQVNRRRRCDIGGGARGVLGGHGKNT